jgi:preprotein translocase subunit SecE
MARQTRAQRRARRQAQAESRAQQQADGRARPATVPQTAAAAAPAEEPRGEIVEHVPGRGFVRFVHESWAELKKVDWPGQSQVIQATTVVLLACAIVGVYLWGADLVLKRLVEKIFLGQ